MTHIIHVQILLCTCLNTLSHIFIHNYGNTQLVIAFMANSCKSDRQIVKSVFHSDTISLLLQLLYYAHLMKRNNYILKTYHKSYLINHDVSCFFLACGISLFGIQIKQQLHQKNTFVNIKISPYQSKQNQNHWLIKVWLNFLRDMYIAMQHISLVNLGEFCHSKHFSILMHEDYHETIIWKNIGNGH